MAKRGAESNSEFRGAWRPNREPEISTGTAENDGRIALVGTLLEAGLARFNGN